jgi:hypothetical protein
VGEFGTCELEAAHLRACGFDPESVRHHKSIPFLPELVSDHAPSDGGMMVAKSVGRIWTC